LLWPWPWLTSLCCVVTGRPVSSSVSDQRYCSSVCGR
jgi:hypothetical protein